MIDYIIPLIGSYFSSGIASYFLWPVLALAFVSFVPALVNAIFTWRD